MSVKKKVISRLFQQCIEKRNMFFDNTEVKKACQELGFGNPFDVTKIDNTCILPAELLQADYCIAHLGDGHHRFVKGINNWYHEFEEITEDNIIKWEYKKSILDELNSSESNILSLGYNHQFIHNFLYDDINEPNPKIYNAHRTKFSFDYKAGKTSIQADKLQIEIDMTIELDGRVTIFECKNNFPANFAIYQIFHPFLYYQLMNKEHKLGIEEVNCCYILKEKSSSHTKVRMYLYVFSNQENLSSIKLIKCKEYNLIQK